MFLYLTGRSIWKVCEFWCQGYSEPGAGSDLAGVRTAAVPEADGRTYRVTGQKIWTSLAHEADWCFVLARTEPGSKRHHGLTFLLVPMDQPGRIEVRPIRQLTGTSDFNEAFFDGARAEQVVGGAGNGWRVAMSLLGFERGGRHRPERGAGARLAGALRIVAVDADPAKEEVARRFGATDFLTSTEGVRDLLPTGVDQPSSASARWN